MKYLFICVFLILSVGACQTMYTHPTKGSQEFERDYYECGKIAKWLADDAGSPDDTLIIHKETERCLQLKFGWTPVEK